MKHPRDNAPPKLVGNASAKGRPTKHDVSRVMASLGRRNKGKRKTMTPSALTQRRNAALASAKKRRKRRKRRNLTVGARYSITSVPPRGKSAPPLAQSAPLAQSDD